MSPQAVRAARPAVARWGTAGVVITAMAASALALWLTRAPDTASGPVASPGLSSPPSSTPASTPASPPSTSAAVPSAASTSPAPIDAEYEALDRALRSRSGPVTATPSPSRAELRQQAERYPRDGRAWALLALAEFEAESYPAAVAAFEKAAAVSPKVAADPGVLCDWADALGMAQGGVLKGRPAQLIAQALALRPNHPKALEMAGSAAYEAGEFALAADYWRRLLKQLAPESGQHRELRAAIARAERLAAPTQVSGR